MVRNTKNNFSVILTAFLFLLTSSSPALSESYQCDVNGDSRLGLEEAIYSLQFVSGLRAGGSQELLDCGPPPDFAGIITNPGTLSPEAKRYLLCQLNETRSRVALGQSEAYGGGYHPVATNMQRVQWDDNLATVASTYAAQCNYQHNANRSDQYATLLGVPPGSVYVGENIYASSVDPSEFSYVWEGDDYGIAGANDSWSAESTNWTWVSTYSSACDGDVCGHFTQMAWAKTTKVGCGYYSCDELINVSWGHTFVVCNYYTAGNYISQPVYLDGESVDEVCTEELQPGDTCENGLITPADYTTGIDYQCDVNGDGKLGLEEAINALQVISGRD